MKLDVYLNYPGTCEQAFRFYEQHLGRGRPDLHEDGRDPFRFSLCHASGQVRRVLDASP